MIHDNTTIGFESEWVDGVDPLLQVLHDKGLLPDNTLHRYHCDCHWCTDLIHRGLRAQRDSTVGGELISGILGINAPGLTDLTTTIEEAAVDTDATPGIGAGFHVHARVRNHAIGDYLDTYTGPLLGAVMLSMPVLTGVFGGGRHARVGGMNVSTLDQARDAWGRVSSNNFPTVARLARMLRDAGLEGQTHTNVVPFEFTRLMIRSDRHAHVAFRTRYQTVEFRLWRSTRMAWRMQTYAWLSALLVNPAFHVAVIDRHGPRTNDDTLADPGWLYELLDAPGVPTDLVPMLHEQADYVEWTRSNRIPATYTVA